HFTEVTTGLLNRSLTCRALRGTTGRIPVVTCQSAWPVGRLRHSCVEALHNQVWHLAPFGFQSEAQLIAQCRFDLLGSGGIPMKRVCESLVRRPIEQNRFSERHLKIIPEFVRRAVAG